MSWSNWSARLNVTSIVSQGLEQVSKLKEDVEKQFDQAVLSAGRPPPASKPAGVNSAARGRQPNDLFPAADAGKAPSTSAPGAAAAQHSVDDIDVRKATTWGGTALRQHPPPLSADGKQWRALRTSPVFARGAVAAGGANSESERAGASAQAESGVDGGHSGDSDEPRALETSGQESCDTAVAETSTPAATDDDSDEEQQQGEQGAGTNDAAEVLDGATIDAANERVSADELSSEFETPDERREKPDDSGDDSRKSDSDNDSEDDDDSDDNRVGNEQARDDDDNDKNDDSADNDDDDSPDNDDNSVDKKQRGDDFRREDKVDTAAPVDTDHAPRHPKLTAPASFEHPPAAADTSAMAHELASLRQHLEARENQLLATSSTIQELHDELDATCQREVTAVERARFLTEQLELMRVEVTKLNRMASGQRESDLQAMQAALGEKDEKLKALLEEGQALSVKQAQFEQRVRQLRKEKNDEEEQRGKLQTQLDAVSAQLHEQTAKLKLVEEDHKKSQQELRRLQSAADASARKLLKAEQDAAAAEQQAQQLQGRVAQLAQRNDDLEKQVVAATATSHSHAALSDEKAALEQSLRFLHESLQDLESEAARREESARAEIQDLKRKWQDAVARVDLMGQSVSDATQPLLRQISALQDDQRARQETWKATEATLLQRIRDATEARRAVELDKLAQEEQVHALQTRVDALEHEARRRASELGREKDRAASAAASERELQAALDAARSERDEWKSKAQAESSAREQLQLRLSSERKLGKRADSEGSEPTAARDAELEALRAREVQLSHDLAWHQKEVRRLKTATLQPPGSANGVGSSSAGLRGSVETSERPLESSSAEMQASILKHSLEAVGGDDDAFAGSTSVLGLSQLQQRVRLREGENRLVKQQLQALEAKQSQLTEEIVRLSTRNALLETNEARFQQTQEELQALRQRQHVLLELFGEKEEQVEELQSEVSELKAFYRKQLDTLAK
ncbi:hypothetical protein PybrP1_007635 [[Pythium] brassicae (nom. inval.)]|nr:hypothetical protein PybrP1_007635 [[Pythium] brassicae (nom. inval.)]